MNPWCIQKEIHEGVPEEFFGDLFGRKRVKISKGISTDISDTILVIIPEGLWKSSEISIPN